ncbi:hypothetical protein Pmani_034100 [Petrolisthes manimaculis]|uniref:Uncharacterized protein n=1 Tax=Petrolisthes manimaculis TaxID=1843537 RepID=A0AAE1TQ25_9EUCA|nr:hypothetical protein Pmani_034100 [Petrolisthes manimaculis]
MNTDNNKCSQEKCDEEKCGISEILLQVSDQLTLTFQAQKRSAVCSPLSNMTVFRLSVYSYILQAVLILNGVHNTSLRHVKKRRKKNDTCLNVKGSYLEKTVKVPNHNMALIKSLVLETSLARNKGECCAVL